MGKNFIALIAVLSIALIVAVGAWLVSFEIESPADVAARTAPPRASAILVPIEKRILSSKIITRGTARFGLPQQISITPSPLKPNVGLLTTLPRRNTVIKEGDVLFTASGRPLFVLQGKQPAYRDLKPGISGADVLQFELALDRLGFSPGLVDGTYDEKTSSAVEAWYNASKWAPFRPTLNQIKILRTLEKELSDAKKNRLSAVSAEAASIPRIETARATAERNNKAAAADLTAKKITVERLKARIRYDKKQTTNAKPSAQSNKAVETNSVSSVRATADRNIKSAIADLAAKKAALRQLEETKRQGSRAVEVAKIAAEHNNKIALADLETQIANSKFVVADMAKARIDRARSAANKIKIEGELAVFRAEREARLLENKIELAVKQVELAEAAVKSARLEGQMAIRNAAIDIEVAELELDSASRQLALSEAAVKSTRLEGQLAIQAALDASKIAKLNIELATEREKRAELEFENARINVGIQVPVDEIVFVPELPVRVNEITASIGDQAKGKILSVTNNKLSIDSSLTLDEAQLVRSGMSVLIDEQALGVKANGKVAFLAETPGTRGVDAYHRYLEVEVIETNVPIEKYSLRLTIPIRSTDGEKTVVPISALSLSTDGTSRLQIQKNNALEYIEVKPGLSADGFVEVTPINASLEPGQLVVVGFEQSKSGP